MAIGGTEQVIRQIVENTDRERFNPSILCIDGKIGALGEQLQSSGQQITAFARKPGFDFSLIAELRKHILENDIHVVHCHQYTPYIYGLFAAITASAKTIFTEHGRFYPDSRKWKRTLVNPILSLATYAITAISKATAQALVDFENFPQNKISVVYNGIADFDQTESNRTDLLAELGIPESNLIIGTISRLDPIKNQSMILKGFASILRTHPNCSLIIVGDGPIREQLEMEAKSLNIQKNTTFTGFKIDPQRYLRVMDIFLLPSLSEGTSMTLLESMALSKPSIVTNVGGNPEIVEHKKTGLVIPNKDEAKFRDALFALLDDKETRELYGQAARSCYAQTFTVEKMISAYQEIYLKSRQ